MAWAEAPSALTPRGAGHPPHLEGQLVCPARSPRAPPRPMRVPAAAGRDGARPECQPPGPAGWRPRPLPCPHAESPRPTEQGKWPLRPRAGGRGPRLPPGLSLRARTPPAATHGPTQSDLPAAAATVPAHLQPHNAGQGHSRACSLPRRQRLLQKPNGSAERALDGESKTPCASWT